jgi:hypothetical protein
MRASDVNFSLRLYETSPSAIFGSHPNYIKLFLEAAAIRSKVPLPWRKVR